jgi:hypothetical protein
MNKGSIRNRLTAIRAKVALRPPKPKPATAAVLARALHTLHRYNVKSVDEVQSRPGRPLPGGGHAPRAKDEADDWTVERLNLRVRVSLQRDHPEIDVEALAVAEGLVDPTSLAEIEARQCYDAVVANGNCMFPPRHWRGE